jgi:transposase
MPRGRDDRGLFPPEDRLSVLTLATESTAEHNCPATRWSLDDLAATIVNEAHAEAMSRSTIWRILDDADLKPHKSVYWLNSHDPDFNDKAHAICKLYLQAPVLYQQGRLVVCCDEKTGMQALERKYPTQAVEVGKPEKREHEYIRHGTLALTASFVVPTGEVLEDIKPTRNSEDFAAHVRHLAEQFLDAQGIDLVLDNLNTHWSLPVCRVVAELCDIPFLESELQTGAQRKAFLTDPTHKHVFHFTPKHGSWLNQVELWFSTLSRRWLARGDFASLEAMEASLRQYIGHYNDHHAHPYRWTYTGEPLVRGTPFADTRRQQQRGRAWFSPRPKRFQRVLYPPRPYNRRAA